MRYKSVIFGILCLGVLCLAGCTEKLRQEKERELSYEVIEEADIPEEMQEQIQERKKQAFLFTYADKNTKKQILYIARGYGEQETDGYEIQVDELYESENAIVIKTTLLGPEPGEEIEETAACPYIVVQTEYSGKYVMAK